MYSNLLGEFVQKTMDSTHHIFTQRQDWRAWKACLKKIAVRLKLLLDSDILLMFERGIRGGITESVHRWAAANNPYTGSKYDKSKPTKYLQYLDANNLYGWAMSQPNWGISLG